MSYNKNRDNIIVLNSATMPSDGIYNKKTISKNQFISIIKEAKVIKSAIGYESVTELIKFLTNISIELNREIVYANDDDMLVGLTLGYRLDPKDKGHTIPTADDYVYFIAEFKTSDVPSHRDNV